MKLAIALFAIAACAASQGSVPYSPDATQTGDSGSGSGSTPDAGIQPVLGCDQAPTIPGTGTITSWSRLTGNVTVSFFGAGTYAVDVTKFDSIWGGELHKTWPGSYGLIADFPLATNKYIAAEFTVPEGYVEDHPSYYGNYSIGESAYSAPVTLSISEHCGDFGQLAPTTIPANCLANIQGSDGFVNWGPAGCKLESGKRYYLNIINADVTAFPATTTLKPNKCLNNQCQSPVMNGYGSWSN